MYVCLVLNCSVWSLSLPTKCAVCVGLNSMRSTKGLCMLNVYERFMYAECVCNTHHYRISLILFPHVWFSCTVLYTSKHGVRHRMEGTKTAVFFWFGFLKKGEMRKKKDGSCF